MYKPNQGREVWRFVTYMFVHLSVSLRSCTILCGLIKRSLQFQFKHLAANLIYQIVFGIALEVVHHWWRVGLIYLAGVLAGSLGASIFTPKIFLAGASGGVYSLITGKKIGCPQNNFKIVSTNYSAHIATIIMNWKEMTHPICQLLVLLFLILYDISDSIFNMLTTPATYKISLWSHLFGGIAGILVGIGILRNLRVRPWERKLWWIAISIYMMLMIAGIYSQIFDPEKFRVVQ